MKRRDLLKGIGLTSLGLVGLNPQVKAAEQLIYGPDKKKKEPWENYGRTEDEAARNARLLADQFFNKHELATITVLVDIIIPRDAHSGSASEAGVPAFIEFMAKDRPDMQTPLRGGLHWLDAQANKRFEKVFIECTPGQQIQIVEDIAYPKKKVPGMGPGVAFFSLMRNLTASGFWSSQMGIADIGYQGNTPNQWEGVSKDRLYFYGFDTD